MELLDNAEQRFPGFKLRILGAILSILGFIFIFLDMILKNDTIMFLGILFFIAGIALVAYGLFKHATQFSS